MLFPLRASPALLVSRTCVPQDAVVQYRYLLDFVPMSDETLGMVLTNLAQAYIDMGLAADCVELMKL